MSNLTQKEIDQFTEDWGQSHEEICSCLDYDINDSDELIMDDGYFWYDKKELWINKQASGFQGKDQTISNYLRNL